MNAPAPTVLERFGTGLLTTEILRGAEGGCTWVRTAGPRAPAPLAASQDDLWRAVEAAGARTAGTVRVAIAESGSEVRRYRAPGPVSMAGALLEGALADPHRAPRLNQVMYGMGRCLHELHTVPLPPAFSAPGTTGSRGLRRLGDWLGGRATSAIGLHSAARMRGLLGEDRWEQLGAWHRAVLEDGQRVLIHGAPGLGSVVGDAHFAAAVLLTGEDLGAAPWYADLGWVLGEITELGAFHGVADPLAWAQLADDLFCGYGREPGPECNTVAALRITLHLHDFLCYVAWSDVECVRYAGLLRVLIDAGAQGDRG